MIGPLRASGSQTSSCRSVHLVMRSRCANRLLVSGWLEITEQVAKQIKKAIKRVMIQMRVWFSLFICTNV